MEGATVRDIPKIVSVDDHVIEPPHLWQTWLPAGLRDRGPKVVRSSYTVEWVDGNQVFRMGGDGPATDFWVYEDLIWSHQMLNACAGYDEADWWMGPIGFDQMRPGCYDPKARLADMDENHVEASLCFPTYPRFCGQLFAERSDKELALACVRAYNDWMVEEWAGDSDGRLVPLSIVPLWDPVLAAAEIERTAAKGARAITFSENPAALGLPSYWTTHWAPMLSALEETDVALCLHIGSSSRPLIPHAEATTALIISLMGVLTQAAVADLVFSEVFNDHPRLKVVLSEGGIGWVPYMLERLEQVWEKHRFHSTVNMQKSPTECFRDNIWSCFIRDEAGLEMRHRIGVDKIMWEADYPHSDCLWPNSRKHLAHQLHDVPDDEARLIAGGNARTVFRL